MCNGCVYFYSDDGPFDPFVWGPWCHCLDSDCPPRGRINVSLSLNYNGVPGFRAAPAPRASFIPSDFN